MVLKEWKTPSLYLRKEQFFAVAATEIELQSKDLIYTGSAKKT